MKNSMMVFLMSMVLPASLLAQNGGSRAGKFGVGIDGFETSRRYVVKYFATDDVAIEGIGALQVFSSGADPGPGQQDVTGYTYLVGADVLYHWDVLEDVTPYVGVGGAWQGDKPGGIVTVEEEEKNTLELSAILGGEYFIAKRFSVGVKTEGVLLLSFSRDVPKEEGTDVTVISRANITARFYF